MRALEHATGFIRREVARRVQLRRAPELIFHWDPSPEKAEHIAQLLDEINAVDHPTTPTEAAREPDGDQN